MSKPYTENDFSDQVEADLNWRRKELSDIKLAIRSAEQNSRSALLKSLVTMIYAHWEGYVKNCALKYFQYLSLRKKPYKQLERQLFINSYLNRLDAFHQTKQSIPSKTQFINEILESGNKRFSRFNPDLVDTKSNLNTDVVKDICTICAVDSSLFEEKRTFIDVIMLKRRNAIAHGQQADIAESDIDGLVAEALSLMGIFKTLVENKVYTQSYLATPASELEPRTS